MIDIVEVKHEVKTGKLSVKVLDDGAVLLSDNRSKEAVRLEAQGLEWVKVLLRAAYDLLHKQTQTPYVFSCLEETVEYDEAECDGYCIMDEIEALLLEMGVDVNEAEP